MKMEMTMDKVEKGKMTGVFGAALLLLFCIAFTGCGRKEEEAAATVVSTEAATVPIVIQRETTEAETEPETESLTEGTELLDLSDRTAADGKVRS